MAAMPSLSRPRTKRQEPALKPVSPDQVAIFKVRNRQSYAAVCLDNLCEGRTPQQAFARLFHPLRRMGYALPDRAPGVRSGVFRF